MEQHIWGYELIVVLLVCLLLSSIVLGKKTSVIVGVTAFWMGLSALRLFSFPVSPYVHETPEWIAMFDIGSSIAIAQMGLYILAAFCFSVRAWIYTFQVIAIINALLLIIGVAFGKPWGLILNASMSGCFAVALLPLFFKGDYYPPFSIILSFLAVISSHQSLPLACFFIMLWMLALRLKKFWVTLAMPLAAVAIGWIVAGKDLFDPSGRTHVWRVSFNWWLDNANYLLGAGSGSFQAIGIYLTKDLPEQFIWMHSDWLQTLFEQGIIGTVLLASLFGYALYRSRKNYPLFFSLFTYGVWAVANMPLRYPLAALYGAVLVRWAFSKENECIYMVEPKQITLKELHLLRLFQ